LVSSAGVTISDVQRNKKNALTSGKSPNDEERVLQDRRRLARSLDELQDQRHDAVRQRLDPSIEFPDDTL
jgi:hypothetical protein